MANESPVNVQVREGEVQGQAQARPTDPHDGVHKVFEAVAVTDRVIKDANSDLAVQVPEGVGASTYGHRSPLGEALSVGTAEEQFAQIEGRDSDDEDDGKVVLDEDSTQAGSESPDESDAD